MKMLLDNIGEYRCDIGNFQHEWLTSESSLERSSKGLWKGNKMYSYS